MPASSLFDELKLKVLQALRLNQSFKADSLSELRKTPKYKQYTEEVKEIKEQLEKMAPFTYGAKFMSIKTGKQYLIKRSARNFKFCTSLLSKT